ncbi:MAG: hypothetical protein AAF067_12060 [Pseudomonadota bacterium]
MRIEKHPSLISKLILGYCIFFASAEMLLSIIGRINYPKYIDLWMGFLGVFYVLPIAAIGEIIGTVVVAHVIVLAIIVFLAFVRFGPKSEQVGLENEQNK